MSPRRQFRQAALPGRPNPAPATSAEARLPLPFPIETVSINLSDLEGFEAKSPVDEAALRESRLVQGRDVRIKILGGGELTKKLEIHAHGFSQSALEKIEKAGGKAVVIAIVPAPEPAAAS